MWRRLHKLTDRMAGLQSPFAKTTQINGHTCYLWGKGPGSSFDINDRTVRSIYVLDFDRPGEIPQGHSMTVLQRAIQLLDGMSKVEREYYLLRDLQPGQCRSITFRDWGDDSTLVVSITVLTTGAGNAREERRLIMCVDDYMRPDEQWVVYGSRTDKFLHDMGYQLGGRFSFIE